MASDDVGAVSTSIPPGASAVDVGVQTTGDAADPGVLSSCRRGASSGARRMSRVIAPITLLALLPGLALTALGIGAGCGWPIAPKWGLPPILLGPVRLYLVCVLGGFLLGALLGLLGALLRKVIPAASRASFVTTARRSFPSVQWIFRLLASIGAGKPRRALWRWSGLVVVLLLVASCGTGVYLGRRVDHRLQEAISAADRDDPFWQLDDLMAHRERVPDAENSAIVVAEVLKLIPMSWPSLPNIRYRPAPRPTAFEVAQVQLSKATENVRLDDDAADAIRREMGAHAEAVRIARTVADSKRGRHELKIGPLVVDTPLSETQAARTAAKLLTADAAIRVHDGDADGALDSCCAILGVARSIGDEPFLISQLIRRQIGREAMSSAQRVLGQGEPSDRSLARFQALVLDELAQPLLLVLMKGDRAILAEASRRLCEDQILVSQMRRRIILAVPGGSRDALMPWDKLMLQNQRAIALEWMNTAVAIARQPVAERPLLWRSLEAEISRVYRSRQGFLFAGSELSTNPAVSVVDTSLSRYQCELGAMAILLAAERHRRKAGDWPASIAAIDPVILPHPPGDPFSDEPITWCTSTISSVSTPPAQTSMMRAVGLTSYTYAECLPPTMLAHAHGMCPCAGRHRARRRQRRLWSSTAPS